MNQIAIGFQMVRMRNADVYNQLLNDVSENVKKKKRKNALLRTLHYISY